MAFPLPLRLRGAGKWGDGSRRGAVGRPGRGMRWGQGVYELLDARAQAINVETMKKWNQGAPRPAAAASEGKTRGRRPGGGRARPGLRGCSSRTGRRSIGC